MTPAEIEFKPGRTDPPHLGPRLRRETRRNLVARLKVEVAELRLELARERAWSALLEDEIDAMRIAHGLCEVPA